MKVEVTKTPRMKTHVNGYSNAWAKRFKEVLMKYELLKTLEVSPDMLRGYKLALDTFKATPKKLKPVKVKS